MKRVILAAIVCLALATPAVAGEAAPAAPTPTTSAISGVEIFYLAAFLLTPIAPLAGAWIIAGSTVVLAAHETGREYR